MDTIFHVVNSVKGGSGKSTFSLILASYFIHKKKESAYIIDLDLQGTSWQKNYDNFFEVVDGQKPVYLNDLMYDFSNNITQDFVRYLKVSDKAEHTPNEWKIPVCVSNPEMHGINEVELDLFENAIYKLINRIIERETAKGSNKVHIVFDMPPSKERHSEKVLNHLLLDKSSYLSKSFPYYVYLYMMSALSPAHIALNIDYIKYMAKDKSYSSIIPKFMNIGGHDSYFHICLVLNDVSNVARFLTGDLTAWYSESELDRIKFTSDDFGKSFKHIGSLKHMDLIHRLQILKMCDKVPMTDTELTISGSTLNEVETCLKDMGLFKLQRELEDVI